jgi:hypothetical protein
MRVLYFSEAYPTTSDDRYFFGSLTIRRLVFDTGEVDSYAGVDRSQDNSSAYTLIGGEGGALDGLVEEAEFVYPMSFAVVDMSLGMNTQGGASSSLRAGDGRAQELGGSGSGSGRRVLAEAEAEVAFDTLVVADHSSHSLRRVFAFMDTAAPSAAPSEFVPPTRAPTPSPTTLLSLTEEVAAYPTAVGWLLCALVLLLAGVCVLCASCSMKQHRSLAEEGGSVELSSASMLTLASRRVRSLFAGGGAGGRGAHYEEMDVSNSSSLGLRDVDLESSEDSRQWSEVSPTSPAPPATPTSASTSRFAGFSLTRAGEGEGVKTGDW